ncbi:MAG: ATP-dependent Clp protease adaptor ClpS [Phycisphaerae bacterium]|nr:ATP-dependent Clp protease adaptor ClpS [Phycisphaerae bacterium]
MSTPQNENNHAPSRPESGTATLPRPTPSRPAMDELPPFRVLLHNDNHNTFEFVIDSLVELTSLNLSRAAEVTLEADKAGVALILVTHRERAELYQEQFTSKGLTVSIEPAS